MPSETLLLGIAQIAVVIAGFTAVTAALTPPGGSWSPGHRLRQRAIVSTSFNVVFEALLPLILFAWLAVAHDAVVLASGAVAIYATWVVIMRARQLDRLGVLRQRGMIPILIAGPVACTLFALNAVVLASVGVYALALCIQLLVPVFSFYALVAASSN